MVLTIPPRAAALAGSIAISFSAIWVSFANVSATTSTFFRPAYALPVLAVLWFAFARRGDTRSRRARALAMGAGVILAVDFAFWHAAIPLIGAGLSTVIANLQVLFVGALAWLIHKERPTAAAFVAVPLGFLGVTLASGLGRGDAFGLNPALGAAFAVGAAVAYTAFLMIFRQSGRGNGNPLGPLMDATIGTAVTGLVIGFATDPGFSLVPTWPAHAWLLVLAISSHTGGWLAISYALPRLPALETSVILLLQPMLTMVWGALLLAEAPSVIQWAGAAFVISGVALMSWQEVARRAHQKSVPETVP